MDEDKNYRAAIYVRVSTDEQAQDGYSLNAQKEMLTNYCISQGW
ncbi:MAG: recombinase family protein, partial [Candidatus Methanomethylophilaceae archaeon]|nr:recombinase family protein [Candidatus Methanomethylophilaceae archaeon]